MGCAASKLENKDTVRRCKDHHRLMKEAVYARHHLAAAHSDYCRSLRLIGTALSTFAAGEPLSVSDNTPAVFINHTTIVSFTVFLRPPSSAATTVSTFTFSHYNLLKTPSHPISLNHHPLQITQLWSTRVAQKTLSQIQMVHTHNLFQHSSKPQPVMAKTTSQVSSNVEEISQTPIATTVLANSRFSHTNSGKTIATRVQLLGCYMLYEVAGFPQISGMDILFKTCGTTNAAGRGFEERRDTAFSVMENGVISGHGFYATSYQSMYVMGQ